MDLLVVDDEPQVLELCRRGLAGTELTIISAGSAREALQLLGQRRFDILLSDIHMGAPGGLELAKLALKRDPSLDVLIMTGYPSMDSVINALKLGVYDFIIKPLDLVLLKAAIRRCVERRMLHARLAEASSDANASVKILRELGERLSALRSAPGAELDHDACRQLAARLLADLERLRDERLAPPRRRSAKAA